MNNALIKYRGWELEKLAKLRSEHPSSSDKFNRNGSRARKSHWI